MSTYFSQTIPDPFVVTSNVIDPLRVSDDIPDDSYSIKSTVYNPVTLNNEIDVKSGTFIGDPISNSLRFQNDIKSTIEDLVRTKFNRSTYEIGIDNDYSNIPSINLYNRKEILIFFNDSNDYFLINYFNGSITVNNGGNRLTGVTFYSTDSPAQFYEFTGADLNASGNVFSVNSSTSSPKINSYTFSFGYFPSTSQDIVLELNANTILGNFQIFLQIRDSDNALILQQINSQGFSFTGSTGTYEILTTTLYPEIRIFRPVSNSTNINPDTYLPVIIPGFLNGLFKTVAGVNMSISQILTYLTGTDTFTTAEIKYLTCILSNIYNSVRNTINHILKVDSVSAINRGYASSSSTKGFALEIKVN